jgi:hypothetical protein
MEVNQPQNTFASTKKLVKNWHGKSEFAKFLAKSHSANLHQWKLSSTTFKKKKVSPE